MKIGFVGRGIPIVFSGHPGRAKELADAFRSYLNSPLSSDLTHENLSDELKQPPMRFKAKLREEYLQLNWGVSYDTYRAGGLQGLPLETQRDIAAGLSNIRFECDMILAPFIDGKARLFTIDDQGVTLEANDFALIGSGAWIAQSNMALRQYRSGISLHKAMYIIYESKLLSETEPSVGPGTYTMVINSTEIDMVSPAGFDAMSRVFEAHSQRPVNDNLFIEEDMYLDKTEIMQSFAEHVQEDDSSAAEGGRNSDVQD